jgi:hypothetical protein
VRARAPKRSGLAALGRAAAATAWLLASAEVVAAQDASGPVFLLQPGLVSTDFVSAGPDVTSTTGFNLRFETRFPTRIPWLTPLVGASVAPYGISGAGGRVLNTPILFLGNIFPLVRARRTGGWLSVQLPVLLQHTYGGGSDDENRLYGRDLHVQLASFLHVGRKVLHELGPNWTKLDVYAFLDQNLTPNRDVVTGRRDRFNPTALFGLSLVIGSSGAAVP